MTLPIRSSLLFAALCGLAAAQAPTADKPRKQPPVLMPSLLRYHSGDALPDVAARRADGSEWRLAGQKGKATIVALAYVDPAKGAEQPLLEQARALAARFGGAAVDTVAVANWLQPADWSAWAAAHAAKWPFPIVADPAAPFAGDPLDNEARMAHHQTTLLGRLFGGGMTPPLPTWFVVDAEGRLAGQFRVPREAPEQANDAVANLLLRAGVQLAADRMPAEQPAADFWAKPAPRPVEAPVQPIAMGGKAPDFVMKDAKGGDVKLADFAGKVVVLDFWATWCGPCKAALPHVQEVARQWKEHGVVVIASCTGDSRAAFDEYVAEHGAKHPDVLFAFDPKERSPERASRALYGVGGIPHQFVIGRDGLLKAEVSGYMPGEVLLDAALAAAGVPVPAATLEQAAADRSKREQPRGGKATVPAAPLQPKRQ